MSVASVLTSRVGSIGQLSESDVQVWDDLCRGDSALRRAFLTPHYARAVERARGGVRVAVFESEGQPVAFFPFQFAGAWQACLRVGEPVGGEMSDAFGLAAHSDVRVDSERLLEAAGLSACEVHHLPGRQAGIGLAAEEGEAGLRVRFDSGWAAYWGELVERQKKFTQKTERRERNVVKEHGPLRLTTRPADPEAVLHDLIAGKREQYARTGARDVLREAWKRELMLQLLRSENETCRGSLYTLHAGETWIATHFGLQCADVLHYWFPVYSQEVSKHSPGHLLLKAIGEQASELGLSIIDRGAGDTQAKRSFANEEQQFGRGRWSRRGLRSSLYGAARSAGWRLSAMRGGSEGE